MARPNFYWQTTKKLIVAFATVFDEIEITDDFGNPYKVPLIFSQKEKFLEASIAGENMNDTDYDIMFPRMGLELVGMNYPRERRLTPWNRIKY